MIVRLVAMRFQPGKGQEFLRIFTEALQCYPLPKRLPLSHPFAKFSRRFRDRKSLAKRRRLGRLPPR